jgi:anti-anti-sigma regulatory factor
VLDITGVAAFREQCQSALETEQDVRLKADELERADTSALQVLAAFFQDATAHNKSVQWQGTSEALRESAALLGLTELLHLNTSGD